MREIMRRRGSIVSIIPVAIRQKGDFHPIPYGYNVTQPLTLFQAAAQAAEELPVADSTV